MQLDALQTLALSVAQATSPAQVLDEMVRGLGMTDGVALARVWLIEDEGGERLLRLRASIGFSCVDPSVRWSRTDGGHERISGVGKELIASAIHEESARSERPLVKVNCASVPRELFESEFFGHVKGAFSGASRQRAGRFALADFEPVGDDRTKRVDVRIVAATNRDLEAEIQCGRFRQDLYYRLKVVPIAVPPLRERPEDILPMARQFLAGFASHLNAKVPALSQEDELAMSAYHFPGNVRELRNVIERAVVMAKGTDQRLSLHLPAPRLASVAPPALTADAAEAALPGTTAGDTKSEPVIPMARIRELERRNIVNALRRCNGKISGSHGAAALLGLKPSTLSYQMKALGIQRGE